MKNEFEKSDFETGMILEFEDGSECMILKKAAEISGYKNVFVTLKENGSGNYGPLRNISDDLINTFNNNKIIKVYNRGDNCEPFKKGELLWERKEEKPILILDDIEYSESTLRSIIKKAQNG